MNKYQVGQVVYLLNQKSLTILPALVVEEIVRKTVDNSTTEYVLEMPDEKKTRVVVTNIKAEIFSDVSVLRDFMLENASKSIEGLIKSAVNTRDALFGKSSTSSKTKVDDVLDVFTAKKAKIKDVKNSRKKEERVQINKKDDIIVNESKAQ